MKHAFLIPLLLILPFNVIAADETTQYSVNDFVDLILDKVESYLDESAIKQRQLDIKRARVVGKGEKPEIIIRRTGVSLNENPYFFDGILFNGQRITSGDPLSRAIEVFGTDYRIYSNRYIWDKLGFSLSMSTPSQRPNNESLRYYLSSITININPLSEDEPKHPIQPSNNFSGYLELDGAGIDKDTKIWELRVLADRTGLAGATQYIICSSSLTECDVAVESKILSDDVSFWTDKNHHDGKIYAVSYSFTDYFKTPAEKREFKNMMEQAHNWRRPRKIPLE